MARLRLKKETLEWLGIKTEPENDKKSQKAAGAEASAGDAEMDRIFEDTFNAANEATGGDFL